MPVFGMSTPVTTSDQICNVKYNSEASESDKDARNGDIYELHV